MINLLVIYIGEKKEVAENFKFGLSNSVWAFNESGYNTILKKLKKNQSDYVFFVHGGKTSRKDGGVEEWFKKNPAIDEIHIAKINKNIYFEEQPVNWPNKRDKPFNYQFFLTNLKHIKKSQ